MSSYLHAILLLVTVLARGGTCLTLLQPSLDEQAQDNPTECVNRLAFFHPPKTAGRAVRELMESYIQKTLGTSLEETSGNSLNSDTPMMSEAGTWPYFVMFHTREPRAAQVMPELKNIRYDDGCRVVTAVLLRDPVERTVSMLNYDMETGCLPPEAKEHADELFGNLSDFQTRFLSVGKYCAICGEFWLRGEQHLCRTEVTAEDHSINLQLLQEFDVVGIDSDVDGFVRQILLEMGFQQNDVANVTVPVFGVTGSGQTRETTKDTLSRLPASQIERIRQYGKFDFELYDAAVSISAKYRLAS